MVMFCSPLYPGAPTNGKRTRQITHFSHGILKANELHADKYSGNT